MTATDCVYGDMPGQVPCTFDTFTLLLLSARARARAREEIEKVGKMRTIELQP